MAEQKEMEHEEGFTNFLKFKVTDSVCGGVVKKEDC